MDKARRVVFSFDERSLESLEKLREQGRIPGEYEEVPIYDPISGEMRTILLPVPKTPRPGTPCEEPGRG